MFTIKTNASPERWGEFTTETAAERFLIKTAGFTFTDTGGKIEYKKEQGNAIITAEIVPYQVARLITKFPWIK